MNIPFNDIYSIARERDNDIRRTGSPNVGRRIQQPEPRRVIARFLQRLAGSSPAPANAAWAPGIEPGR
jgi:hypothetical protein